jgi:ribonucleoside-diphosphate reductase alpha chain
MTIPRFLSSATKEPQATVKWETREALIKDPRDDSVVFQKDGVGYPNFWSQQAVNIVTQKYFTSKETHLMRVIDRVAGQIEKWGVADKYFATKDDGDVFVNELKYILLHQYMAFNSPVWFNVGVRENPQCSACFLNSVEDNMESIMDLAKTEAMLFKWGSGTGTNLSPLRGTGESLSGGGSSSGPVSFMRGFDAFAGIVKSGGKTRRAAKMVILNVDHPDVKEFIWCKATEERKAAALINSGYDSNFSAEGGAYDSIFYQNANHSVRVTDEFMEIVQSDDLWSTRNRVDGSVSRSYPAEEILRDMAKAAWECGDPGIQFDTTINKWHTSKASGKINMSNPCSEYMYLDDTACNLASVNLLKFWDDKKQGFDFESFEHVCRITVLAQDILVDNAAYPTKKITKNSHAFRPLGLGYTNLGALLMLMGLPYDSEEARKVAGTITSLMTAAGYKQSADMAVGIGAFKEYNKNQESFNEVMRMHYGATENLCANMSGIPGSLEGTCNRARQLWTEVVEATKPEAPGVRNGQISVLAPTGTISFFMDCDTTGIEPELALIKYKRLVGGGIIKIVNTTVSRALTNLDYSPEKIKTIEGFIAERGGIPVDLIKPEHTRVFDCSFPDPITGRSISWNGHVEMMAAVQPFVSGAISKTINMPKEATVEDIEECYKYSWARGLKAVAVYRDGCKQTQPLSNSLQHIDNEAVESREVMWGSEKARKKLPETRPSTTHKYSISGHDGYITAGFYPETGHVGEVFVVSAKEGSTVSGLMDAFATIFSIALQYGVPLEHLTRKLRDMRFEPSGMTKNKDIRFAKSIVDYVARWLETQQGVKPEEVTEEDDGATNGATAVALAGVGTAVLDTEESVLYDTQHKFTVDAPVCTCGSLMAPNGRCYSCPNCGEAGACD